MTTNQTTRLGLAIDGCLGLLQMIQGPVDFGGVEKFCVEMDFMDLKGFSTTLP